MTAITTNSTNVVLNTSIEIKRKFKLTAFLHTNGLPLSNKLINFYVSYDGVNYQYITTAITNNSGIAEAYYYDPTDASMIYFQAEFEGDEDWEPSYTTVVWSKTAPQVLAPTIVAPKPTPTLIEALAPLPLIYMLYAVMRFFIYTVEKLSNIRGEKNESRKR